MRNDLSWVLIIGFLLMIGCKSQSKKTQTDTKTEIKKKESKAEKQEVSSSLTNHFEKTHLENEVLNYDFSLQSKTPDKPARLTEYRNGKPYRTLVAENAEYTENKSQEAKTKSQEINKYSEQLTYIAKRFITQEMEMQQLKSVNEEIKSDNLKIASTLKYLAISFILFLVIWIAERSGLFSLIKTRFKKR